MSNGCEIIFVDYCSVLHTAHFGFLYWPTDRWWQLFFTSKVTTTFSRNKSQFGTIETPTNLLGIGRGVGAVFGLFGSLLIVIRFCSVSYQERFCTHLLFVGSDQRGQVILCAVLFSVLSVVGFWAIWIFFMFLLPISLGFLFLHSSLALVTIYHVGLVWRSFQGYTLLAFTAVSRLGLWTFDLSMTQLLQGD